MRTFRERAHAKAGVVDDGLIEEVLLRHGPLDPMALVRRLQVQPGDAVGRLVELTVAGTIAVADGKFCWRGRP